MMVAVEPVLRRFAATDRGAVQEAPHPRRWGDLRRSVKSNQA
jgi:hypothetical protein